ncbi:ELWxxDGT repeat protein [Dyadobacter sp. NIV53]|uniref:ELWxxDGT repeat protein n=1 Tax=Dyadobacter sp. NIV53 TaxID=2861765 RepID=UPI001C867674|nr:ELWxxDGT repeat protein [Dyadobacter sp. NIV53]
MLTDVYYKSDGPTGLFAANGLAFCQFTYNDSTWLFRSDGTTAGTFPLKELRFENPVEINGTVYFSSPGSDGSGQLWKTDGTVAGTSLVKEVVPPGIGSTGPLDLINFDGVLYFLTGELSETGSTIYKLWKSDRTAAGTIPGPALLGSFRPAAVNGYMYFIENYTLKRTDGINITPIKRFPNADPESLIAVGTTIYFAARQGNTGLELWKSDGTAAGTVLVKDLFPGPDPSNLSRLTNVDGTLFFIAQSDHTNFKLWKSDGTAAGTFRVFEFPDGAGELITIGNRLIFSVSDDSDTGGKIWKTDGTDAGTQVIADIYGTLLTHAGGTLFFSGTEDITGSDFDITQVFKSDLTSESTVPVTTLSGPRSVPQHIFDFDGTGYFTANDGINNFELWKTDKTALGTALVRNIYPGTGGSFPDLFTNVNGTLFFAVDSREIWKSNGTSEGTVLVKEVIPLDHNERIAGMIGLNSTLFLGVITTSQKLQLWKSDGTTAGTVLLRTISNTGSFEPVALNGQIYFLAPDGVNSNELWKSDGTAAGTTVVTRISNGPGNGSSPAVINNFLYYILTDQKNKDHLLVKSDGTAEGTTVLKNLYPDEDVAHISGLFTAGNLVYFHVVNKGKEYLWRTDGAAAGTIQLGTFDEQYTTNLFYRPVISHLTDVGGKLFFVPCDNDFGDQLWVSDGTPSGTHMVKRIGRGTDKITISHSAAVGNVFYFTPNDPATGSELWRSDGTSAGTYLVYDHASGITGTSFFDLANVGGTLLISADAGEIGAELYKYQPAQPAILLPLADAYVRNSPGDQNNYGMESTLEIKAGSLPAFQRNTYLKFPLDGISQIRSAKLRLYGSNVQNGEHTSVSAYGVSDDSWIETDITWDNAPVFSESAQGSVNVSGSTGYYEIDVTTFVQSELAGDMVASLVLTNPDNQNTRLIFNSRESKANRPQLVIEANAPPAARLTAEEFAHPLPGPEASGIYPNPAATSFTINVSGKHHGKIDLRLISLSGNTFQIQARQAGIPASRYEVDV